MSKKSRAHAHSTHHVTMPVNRCFACGPANPDGMHLKFYFDEPGRRAWSRFKLARRYQGPPGHAHGGIIATILDEAMGKVNKLRHVLALTSRMQVEYLRPVPLGQTLIAEGHERSVRGRRHINVGEIKNQNGEVLARGRGLFIAVNPEKMFAKHLKKNERTGPLANLPR